MRRVAAIIEAGYGAPPGRRAVGMPRRHRRTAQSGRHGGTTGSCARPASRRASRAPCAARRELLPSDACDEFVAGLEQDCHDIAGILQTVRMVRAASTTVRDLIAGYGEIWSTQVCSRGCCDARGRARQRRSGSTRARSCWWSGGRSGPACAGNSRAPTCSRAIASGVRGHAHHHRLHRHRHAGPADHARPQRQRLLRRRSSARCSTRRRSTSGPTSTACCRADPRLRARRHGHRRAVVQRGHGARVLRRQGDPSADHGAGGRASGSRSGSATPSRPRSRAR